MASKAKRHISPPGVGDRPRCVRWTSAQAVAVQRQILADSGQDPGQVPDVPFRFIKLQEFRMLLGLSTASIYRAMAAGKIPRPVVIDGLTRSEQSVIA